MKKYFLIGSVFLTLLDVHGMQKSSEDNKKVEEVKQEKMPYEQAKEILHGAVVDLEQGKGINKILIKKALDSIDWNDPEQAYGLIHILENLVTKLKSNNLIFKNIVSLNLNGSPIVGVNGYTLPEFIRELNVSDTKKLKTVSLLGLPYLEILCIENSEGEVISDSDPRLIERGKEKYDQMHQIEIERKDMELSKKIGEQERLSENSTHSGDSNSFDSQKVVE